jgi:acyl-phosphate glycerol 3-phosphate acyltransferase
MTGLLLATTFLLAYLLGAIPFGYLIARARGVDIRKVGSGNIGATNVARTVGKKWGMLVFLLDFAKGAVPVLVAGWCKAGVSDLPPNTLEATAGVAAFLGHLFPVYLGFRGGKGVATGAGVVAVLLPGPALVAVLVWVLLLVSTRFVVIASLGAAAVLAVWPLLFTAGPFAREHAVVTLFCLTAAVLVFVRHQSNIRRLLTGTEHQVKETAVMFQVSKILHVMAVGLWFGMVVFFTLWGVILFNTFDDLSKQPAEQRPWWFRMPEEVQKDPPGEAFPNPLAREQASRTAGHAVGPIFPWFFGIQTGCAVVALITAWGWSGRDQGRAQKTRKIVLALGLASVLAGWWLEHEVSKLRQPRNDLSDQVLRESSPSEEQVQAASAARKAFGQWHGYSLMVNMLTLVLATVAMGLTASLPGGPYEEYEPRTELILERGKRPV